MDTFNPSQMPGIQATPEKKPVGPLIAVIIILALIIIGGLYFLKERSNKTYVPPPVEVGDNVTASLKQQSASDDLNTIEADLNATNLDSLDQGAAAIQAELNAQ
jgi:hypothetical protein